MQEIRKYAQVSWETHTRPDMKYDNDLTLEGNEIAHVKAKTTL